MTHPDTLIGIRIKACKAFDESLTPQEQATYYDQVVEGDTEAELKEFAEEYIGWHLSVHRENDVPPCEYEIGGLYKDISKSRSRRKKWVPIEKDLS